MAEAEVLIQPAFEGRPVKQIDDDALDSDEEYDDNDDESDDEYTKSCVAMYRFLVSFVDKPSHDEFIEKFTAMENKLLEILPEEGAIEKVDFTLDYVGFYEGPRATFKSDPIGKIVSKLHKPSHPERNSIYQKGSQLSKSSRHWCQWWDGDERTKLYSKHP